MSFAARLNPSTGMNFGGNGTLLRLYGRIGELGMSDESILLARYGEIKLQIFDLQTELTEIEQALERHVTQNGPLVGSGFVAEYKIGRRKVDHEAVAKENGVPQEIIERHTKTRETVAWAKVTKEAGIPQVVLDMYTEVGDGRLEVKPIID
jgi:hypothetical protein